MSASIWAEIWTHSTYIFGAHPERYSKTKDFERWKTEVNAWNDVVIATNSIDKKAIGQVLALSVPGADEVGDLRGKVMDAMGDTLKGEGGFAALIK